MSASSPGPSDYERALADKGLTGITVFHRQSTGSTNDDARAIAGNRTPMMEDGAAIVIAETQTQGRGRGSNSWFSLKGSISLTITVPGLDVSRLGVLPLGVGAAVTSALRDLQADAFVKWPNDVLIEDGKVGGILCESSLLAGTARVFIGIGINVEADSAPPSTRATTLAAHGISVDRPQLVAEVTARVMDLLGSDATGEEVVEGWKALSVPWWGEEATVVENEIERRVTVLDVSPTGQLVVGDAAGVVRSLTSGEVRQLRVVSA